MTMAAKIMPMAILEVISCRAIMLFWAAWRVAARASPFSAASFSLGEQALAIKPAASVRLSAVLLRATLTIFSASTSHASTVSTKAFSSVLLSSG